MCICVHAYTGGSLLVGGRCRDPGDNSPNSSRHFSFLFLFKSSIFVTVMEQTEARYPVFTLLVNV